MLRFCAIWVLPGIKSTNSKLGKPFRESYHFPILTVEDCGSDCTQSRVGSIGLRHKENLLPVMEVTWVP